MWIIFTISSTGVCGWFLMIGFYEYFSFAVVTNVQNILEQPSEFLTVSFCTNDRIYFNDKNLTELIEDCWFAYDNLCKTNPYLVFERFYSDNYKTCYRFNSGFDFYGNKIAIRYSKMGGRDDSFRLKIRAPSGLALWIHNHTYQPRMEWFDNHNSNMNLASTSMETQFIIDKMVETKLSEPYNKCLKDVRSFDKNKTLIDFLIKDNHSYTQMKCLDYCFQLEYFNKNPCNCTSPAFDSIWEYCFINKENKSSSGCTLKYKEKFYKKEIMRICADYCPPECDLITYYISVDSYSYTEKNSSYIVVYYRSLRFLSISQQAKSTLVDFISNVGGILGVFIGISFLSIVEIIEVITELFYNLK
jgi:hypothetical protein